MSTISRTLRAAAYTIVTWLALPASAAAGSPLELVPADQGTVHLTRSFANVSLQHSPSETAMTLMSFGLVSGGSTDRAYALFDIPAGLEIVASASLQLHALLRAVNFPFPYDFSLHEVSSSASAFQASFSGPATSASQALFDDLADGALYANASLPVGVQTLDIPLTDAAMAKIAVASGSVFGIGFSGGGLPALDLSDLKLSVTTVPEPAAGWLWLAGMSGLLAAVRRSRAQDEARLAHISWVAARRFAAALLRKLRLARPDVRPQAATRG